MKALKDGDSVAVVAPSSPVDGDLLDAGVKALTDRGFEVHISPAILSRKSYLAGDDERRRNELNHHFIEGSTRAIFAARGGYGVLRIIDGLDFESLAADPKPVIGFSDATALLSYLSTHLGIPSFHGCMPATSMVLDPGGCHLDLLASMLKDEISYPYLLFQGLGCDPSGGPVRGEMFGGCLSIIASTLGTLYAPLFDGRILFLEEVEEKAYRVDRMMTQLRISGLLERVKAVVTGRFVPVSGESGEHLEEVVSGVCQAAGIPLFTNFPGGHRGENLPIPFGVPVEIDPRDGKGSITILKSPFAP